jgi:psp operon transcriptional activator
LFGYEAGAFTGAEQRRLGRFEVAHQSTLFLDEIGNIPMEAQEKILRVIEYGTFERVGSTESITVDVRIIAATNANLPALVAEGRFKPDLLDRLSFEVLFLPPLRQRQGDIQLLANFFAAQMAHELGRTAIPEFSDEAIDALESYHWPGNIRELKNAVERAVYRADSERVTRIVFDPFNNPYTYGYTSDATVEEVGTSDPPINTSAKEPSFHEAVRNFEIKLVKRALDETRHHQRRAAQRLGLTYHQFRGLYRKYRESLDPMRCADTAQ